MAVLTGPGLQWLGLFPSMVAMNKYLAQMNKSPDLGKATKGGRPVLKRLLLATRVPKPLVHLGWQTRL